MLATICLQVLILTCAHMLGDAAPGQSTCEKIENCAIMFKTGCGCFACNGGYKLDDDNEKCDKLVCDKIENCEVMDKYCMCDKCVSYKLSKDGKWCDKSGKEDNADNEDTCPQIAKPSPTCTNRAPNTEIKGFAKVDGRTVHFDEGDYQDIKCAKDMWDKQTKPVYTRHTTPVLESTWVEAKCDKCGSWKIVKNERALDCVKLDDPNPCLNGGMGWTEKGKTTCKCPSYRTGDKCEDMSRAFCNMGCKSSQVCKISDDRKSAGCVEV